MEVKDNQNEILVFRVQVYREIDEGHKSQDKSYFWREETCQEGALGADKVLLCDPSGGYANIPFRSSRRGTVVNKPD